MMNQPASPQRALLLAIALYFLTAAAFAGDCSVNDTSGYCGLPGFTNDVQYTCRGTEPRMNPAPLMGDRWGFLYGQCTSYVAYRMNCTSRDCSSTGTAFNNAMAGGLGDAEKWAGAFLRDQTYKVDEYPRVGDIAAWTGGEAGHVALVTAVNNDGSVNVSEYNINSCAFGTRNNRVADYYIHYPNVFNETAPVPLAKPLMVSAFAEPDGTRLTWRNLSSATTSVRIKRQKNNEPATILQTFSNRETHFVDSKIVDGNSYYYWIENEKTQGTWVSSDRSYQVVAVGKAQNLKQVYEKDAMGRDIAHLTWEGAATVGNTQVYYVIERDRDLNGNWTVQSTIAGMTGGQQSWRELIGTSHPRYRVYAKTATNDIGATVAAGKPKLYFPLLSWDDNNLDTRIAIANDNDAPTTVTIYWRQPNGALPTGLTRNPETVTLAAHQTIERGLPGGAPNRVSYSVMVEGSYGQTISGSQTAEKYANPVQGIQWKSYWAQEAIDQAATGYAIPIIQYNNYGWNSNLVIQNPDPLLSIKVSLEFFGVGPGVDAAAAGALCNHTDTSSITLRPLESRSFSIDNLDYPDGRNNCFASVAPDGWYGAATIRATYASTSNPAALLATYTQIKVSPDWSNASVMGSALGVAGKKAQNLYAPIIQNYGLWTNGIAAADLSGNTSSRLDFNYSGPVFTHCGKEPKTLPAVFNPRIDTEPECVGAWSLIKPNGLLDNISVQINQLLEHNHPLVGTPYENRLDPRYKVSEDASGYTALTTPGRRVIIPTIKTLHAAPATPTTPRVYGMATGISVQNTLESNQVTIAVNYYDVAGERIPGVFNYPLKPNGVQVLTSSQLGGTIPDAAVSAMIEVEDRGGLIPTMPNFGIVAVVNILALENCADCIMSYSASARR